MSDPRHVKTTGRRITFNAVSNGVAVGVDMVISFVLLAFILRRMSKEVYGIWEVTGGIFAYTSLLQLGLNSAVNYFIPQLLVKKDYASLSRVVSTAAVFYGLVSLVVLSATVILVIYFPVWFNIDAAYVGVSRIVVAMVGGFFVVSVPLAVFSGILSGLQRYVPLNAVRLSCRLTRVVLIVVLLSMGYGLVGLAVGHVTTRLIEALALPAVACRYLPELRIRPSLASLDTMRQMVGYSIHTTLWSLSGMIRDRAAFIIIGICLTTGAAAMFAVPSLLTRALYSIVQAFSSVTKPAASALMAEGKTDMIEALVLRGGRYVSTLVLPVVAFVALFGKAIIELWVGKDFHGVAGILSLLIVSQVFTLGQTAVAYVMIGLGRHQAFGLFTLVMALLSIVAMVVLTTVYELGLWGIAIGISFPAVITGTVFIPAFTCKALGIGLWHYCWNVFFRPVLAALPFFVVLAAIWAKFDPHGIAGLAATLGVSLPLLFICDYLLVLDPRERDRLLTFLDGLRRRGAPRAT